MGHVGIVTGILYDTRTAAAFAYFGERQAELRRPPAR